MKLTLNYKNKLVKINVIEKKKCQEIYFVDGLNHFNYNFYNTRLSKNEIITFVKIMVREGI